MYLKAAYTSQTIAQSIYRTVLIYDEKAFQSVQNQAILSDQLIEDIYAELLQDIIFTNSLETIVGPTYSQKEM